MIQERIHTDILDEQLDFAIQERDVKEPVAKHSHDYLELAYIVRGWTLHTLNGKTQRLTVGNYMILDYGETHSYDVVSDDLVVINCLFQPRIVDSALSGCRSFRELLNNYMINLGYVISQDQTSEKLYRDAEDMEILQLLRKISAENERQETGYIQLIRAFLIEIIIRTMRRMEENTLMVMRKYDEGIMEIMLKINQKPNQPHSLSAFAKEQNMSAGTLSRKFKSTTGLSFSSYLQKKRMEQACRLLSHSDSKIPEIAVLSGYNDLKFFNSVFKIVIGETPTQYRKRMRFAQNNNLFHRF